jgi:hypothetical protein
MRAAQDARRIQLVLVLITGKYAASQRLDRFAGGDLGQLVSPSPAGGTGPQRTFSLSMTIGTVTLTLVPGYPMTPLLFATGAGGHCCQRVETTVREL